MERDHYNNSGTKVNYLIGRYFLRGNAAVGSKSKNALKNMPNAQHISYAKSLSTMERVDNELREKIILIGYNRAFKGNPEANLMPNISGENSRKKLWNLCSP